MNTCMIVGNLGADPKTHTKDGEIVVANLRVATNERVKVGDEWKDHTEWHAVAVFGGRARSCSQYLKKGSKVGVRGKLRTRTWEKGDQTHYSTEILADEVEFLSPKGSGSGGGGGGAPADRYGYSGGGAGSSPGGGDSQREKPADDFDDDVPFRTRTYIPAEYRGGRQGRR